MIHLFSLPSFKKVAKHYLELEFLLSFGPNKQIYQNLRTYFTRFEFSMIDLFYILNFKRKIEEGLIF